MTVQINIRIPDDMAAKFDRLATARNMGRPEAARWAIEEVIEADELGRAVFERPPKPRPDNFEHLASRMESLAIELERVSRQNAKRDAELARQAREDTLGVSAARHGIADDVTMRVQEMLTEVRGELAAARAEIAALIERPPQFGAIETKLDQIEALAREPRTQTTIAIKDIELSRATGLVIIGVIWSVCLATFMALALVLPQNWLAVRTANFLLGGGDQAICALVNHRMAVNNCRTTTRDEAMIVTVSSEQARDRKR